MFSSPNSVATLWGSYGNGKASGVDRWCADPCAANLSTLPGEKFPRDRKFAFRLRETGPRRGPFRRCVLACAPCRFSEIRKCAKREGFERCENRRKGCSKLEVVKNRHFSWQAQYLVLLKSVLESSKCSFCETVVEFGSDMLTSFRVAVTGLRMPRTHFFVAGAVLASQNIEKSHFVL